jgi:hypothetical protein
MAQVQEERQDDDREPRQPGGDVADGGELGRPANTSRLIAIASASE